MIDYGFFASYDNDRVYSDEHFAEYFSSFISDGVFLSSASSLQVMKKQNMTLSINDGMAMIEGRWFKVKNGADIVIPNANGSYSRYDRIVIRCNYASRLCELVVINGIPAKNPVIPSIVRDGTYFDLSLAVVLVGAGVTTISQADITDTRSDSAVCGFVKGLVDQIDSTSVFAQYQDWWVQFVNGLGNSSNVSINSIDTLLRSNVKTHLANTPISQSLKLI